MKKIGSIARLLTLALILAATQFVSSQAFAASPTAPVDNDHDGINDDLEQRLAEMYAPLVYIEPDESNYPVNVDWFLARAHMQYHEDCTFDVDDDVGPNPIGTQLLGPDTSSVWSHGQSCGSDDTGYSHPPHREITTIARDPDGQWSAGSATTGYSDQQTFVLNDLADSYKVGSQDPHDWVTYFHAYPTSEGGIIIQYWHVFAYNEFGGGFDNHGGDWDASIQVQLNPDLTLKGVWFSRHLDDHPGTFFYADHQHGDPIRLFDGTHPVVTIDGGGHASFRSPDDWATCNCRVGESETGPIGTVVWTQDSDPIDDPASLRIVEEGFCHTCPTSLSSPSGGVIWKTWTNGNVVASGNLTHAINAPSAHGGLVNLGEYNPCTPTSCYGSAQASTLLSGQFYPLNNQFWLPFEGRWGSSGRINSGPRDPVFQGFEDRGEGNISIYRAWYNEGAASPATNDGTYSWLVPPTTTAMIGTPSYTSGTATFVTSETNITLNASESDVATRFGAVATYYRFYQQGSALSSFTAYTGPFGLRESGPFGIFYALPDGVYDVQYYSIDGLGNAEARHTLTLTLGGAPITTLTLTTTGTGSGTVNGGGIYTAIQTATISATPSIGSIFNGWTGPDATECATGSVLMNADKSCAANFVNLPTSIMGNITAKSGPASARIWTLSLLDNGPGTANNVIINSFKLVQTSGAACTLAPFISSFPLALGNIPPLQTVMAYPTINFSGCAAAARFTATFTYSANGGAVSGSVVRTNQFQ